MALPRAAEADSSWLDLMRRAVEIRRVDHHPTETTVRAAHTSEVDQLAEIWHEGWQDAHAAILPGALARLRTLESFRERIAAALPQLRVVGPLGDPLGFCIIKHDELDQLFVASRARGLGVARELLSDAERRLAANGVATAWLACAIGNDRAARFYEKNGWYRAGIMTHRPETPDGTFTLEVWRYEKRVAAG